MAKIVGMEKQTDCAKITLEVSDAEMRNLDLNNPVLVFSKSKLDLKATTHKVPSQSGSSLYILLPAALKKLSKKVPLKEIIIIPSKNSACHPVSGKVFLLQQPPPGYRFRFTT